MSFKQLFKTTLSICDLSLSQSLSSSLSLSTHDLSNTLSVSPPSSTYDLTLSLLSLPFSNFLTLSLSLSLSLSLCLSHFLSLSLSVWRFSPQAHDADLERRRLPLFVIRRRTLIARINSLRDIDSTPLTLNQRLS